MARPISSIFAAILLFAAGMIGPAAAQLGAAVTIDGWERSTASTGTTYYRCRASTCAPNSTVSYRAQEPGRLPPLATFRAQHEAQNQRLIAASNGRITRIEMIETSEGENAGARLQTAVKVIESSDGRREYLATSLVADDARRFSIVSTAPSEAAARTNLQTFLPIVRLSGHLERAPAPTR